MDTPVGIENLAFSSELKTHEKVTVTLWIQRNQSGSQESVISKAKETMKIDLNPSEPSQSFSVKATCWGLSRVLTRLALSLNNPLSPSHLPRTRPEESWLSSNTTGCCVV